MAANYMILADTAVLYIANDPDHIVLDPKLTLKDSGTDSLSFIVPPTNVLYNQLNRLSTVIEVKYDDEIIFRGRIVDMDMDFYKQYSVTCEGAMAFLGDTIMNPYAEGTYTTASALFQAAINQHNSLLANGNPKKRFYYSTSDVTTQFTDERTDYSYTSEILSTLREKVGGHFKISYNGDGNAISYLADYTDVSNQKIVFGENLLDITKSMDCSDVFTSIIARSGEINSETHARLVTGIIDNQTAINKYGRIIKHVDFDDIKVDENTTEEQARAQLLASAQVSLAFGVIEATSMTIKAIDLHILNIDTGKIRIGNKVNILSYPHNISEYVVCSEIDMDLVNPENTAFTFGRVAKALTDQV